VKKDAESDWLFKILYQSLLHLGGTAGSGTVLCRIDLHFFFWLVMAAAISAVRNNMNKPSIFEDTDESLFDTLISKLPTKDTWDAEFFLGILVLG
jgi:hypothetical protein